jgi:hypothetical protein
MPYDPLDKDADCFKPPAIPIEVHCIHCGEEYQSYLMEWRIEVDADGNKHGFWCCPTPDCDGKGFCFDILPIDADYVGEDGEKVWHFDDEDEEEPDDAELEAEFGGDNEPLTQKDSASSDPPDDLPGEEDVPF